MTASANKIVPPSAAAAQADAASPSHTRRLAGQAALVTGGAQGIGLAVAERLAKEGAHIALHVRKEDDRSADAQRRIAALGARCEVFAGDLRDVPRMQAVVAEANAAFGRLDVLVNNAGLELRADFLDTTEDDYDTVLDVNLKGAFFTAQAFARTLRDAKRPGRIIHMSSVHEDLPFPHFTSYCASKGGMRMLMRNMAIELAPLGITVNNVAPGAIRTPINDDLMKQPDKLAALTAQIPLGRMGEPPDVAGTVAFLASADAAYITGATLVVDGGLLWNYAEQ
ncbi:MULTISPECIES: glucose 1-dehydrogenase [unclassified Acidovorax]|uniref:SDR family NAD(P)-dependent oxidoreductase n=1 Tax=unclassified Acidovorax TaxID=2684926 RepID=UPI00288342FC|nr:MULTISPECIES: glucose 1-dehydrogenase [unclassified Acidovorax]